MTKNKSENTFAFFDKLSKTIIPNWNPALPSIPDTLYHYTDASGLLGIVENNEIWATDSRFLNDRTELIYAEQLALEVATRRAKSPRSLRSGEFLAQCLDKIGDYESEHSSFLFCMSAHADSLSQWRGYAQEGRGFTVGFDGKSLSRASGGDSGFSLQKVEYDLDTQTNTISILLEHFEDHLDTMENEDCIEDAVFHFVWSIYRLTYIYKHRSFRSEEEWRLVSVITTNEKDPVDPKRSIVDNYDGLLLRSRSSEIVPYTILQPRIKTKDRLMIKTVGVGPGFPSNNQTLAATHLLRKHGYDADTYSADTTFRRM